MTGAVQAGAAAAGAGDGISVTIGNSGLVYGYAFASFGSISRSVIGGRTILAIQSDGSADFAITMNGTPSQAAFRLVRVQDTAGGSRAFLSTSATFTLNGSLGEWRWGSGSNKVWTSTSPSPRVAVFSV